MILLVCFCKLSSGWQPILYLNLLFVELGDGLRLPDMYLMGFLVLECEWIRLSIGDVFDCLLMLVQLFVGPVVSALTSCHRIKSR